MFQWPGPLYILWYTLKKVEEYYNIKYDINQVVNPQLQAYKDMA